MDNRLKEHGLGVRDGLDESAFSRGDKGDFFGIDGVELAVVNLDLNARHRIASDGTVFECVADSFLDRGHELSWDRAADGGVYELEAGVVVDWERLDAEVDLAKLTCAAGLFLVAVVAFAFGRDGFFVGDARGLCDELDAHLVFELFEDNAEMELAEPTHNGLLGGGDALDDQ